MTRRACASRRGQRAPWGGAIALIAAQGHVGPFFILTPVLAGILVLLLVELFTNDLVCHRRCPEKWG